LVSIEDQGEDGGQRIVEMVVVGKKDHGKELLHTMYLSTALLCFYDPPDLKVPAGRSHPPTCL
jgi:hypothetical protein